MEYLTSEMSVKYGSPSSVLFPYANLNASAIRWYVVTDSVPGKISSKTDSMKDRRIPEPGRGMVYRVILSLSFDWTGSSQRTLEEIYGCHTADRYNNKFLEYKLKT